MGDWWIESSYDDRIKDRWSYYATLSTAMERQTLCTHMMKVLMLCRHRIIMKMGDLFTLDGRVKVFLSTGACMNFQHFMEMWTLCTHMMKVQCSFLTSRKNGHLISWVSRLKVVSSSGEGANVMSPKEEMVNALSSAKGRGMPCSYMSKGWMLCPPLAEVWMLFHLVTVLLTWRKGEWHVFTWWNGE